MNFLIVCGGLIYFFPPPPPARSHSEKDLEVQRRITGSRGWSGSLQGEIKQTQQAGKDNGEVHGFRDCYEWHRKVTKECLAPNFCKVRSTDIKGKYQTAT